MNSRPRFDNGIQDSGLRLRDPRLYVALVPEGTTDDAALALKINHLARSGDSAAQKAYGVLAEYLAEGIANPFNLVDPQAVLLSGGLIEDYAQFVSDVEKEVAKLLHFGAKRQPQVRAAGAGRFAGVQGAAALVFESGR